MSRSRPVFAILGTAAVLFLGAVAAIQAQTPPLSPKAAGYASFALGKWADIQAQNASGDRQSQLYSQALSDYRAALAAHPDSLYLTGQVADLLARMGRNQDALDLARQAVSGQPQSAAAQKVLASVYLDELSNAPQPLTPDGQQLLAGTVAAYQRLVQLAPSNVDDHVMLGRLYGARGQSAAADQEFRAALAITPGDSEAVASLVQSLAAAGKLDAAAQVVDALPAASQNPQADAVLAEAYRSRQLYDKAAAAFRLAIQAEPDNPALESALAQTLLDSGDYPQALTEFEKLEKLEPTSGQAALRVAQAEMQMGQLEAASTSLQRAGKLLPPNNIEVAYTQALLDQSLGDFSDAIAALRALVARPTNPRTQSIFLDQLARLEMQQGDEAAAVGHLHQLQALGGNYAARAQALEVELYTRNRDFPHALALLQAELKASPDSRPLRLQYAQLLGQSGQTAQALAALDPLSGATPAWDVALTQTHIEAAAGNWSAAAASARRAQSLAASPTEKAAAIVALGSVQTAQRHWKNAEKTLRAALALDPADADALSRLGFVLARRGHNLDEALTDAERAVAGNATNGDYLDALGAVYLRLNRTADAVATLKKASRLLRNDPIILDHLGQAYARSGDWAQAAQSWRAALAQLQSAPETASASAKSRSIQNELKRVPAAAAAGAE